mmetsp:Transcript_82949/g.173679  ORF Transcript_82949/g.173679 Transcript_82949/m.173679 type:complete len:404 (-) Transcript_82949:111-1322(-)
MAPTTTKLAIRVLAGVGEKGKGLDENKKRLLRQPRGLHVTSDGSVVVADYGNHCVLKFRPGDGTGQVVAGEEGKSLPDVDPLKDIDKPLCLPQEEGVLIMRPGAVCSAHQGEGYLVLDTEDACIQRFVPGTRAVVLVPFGGKSIHKSNGSPESIKNPRHMFMASDGSIILCDTWSHRVLRFHAPEHPEASRPVLLAGTPNSFGKDASKLAFPSCAFLDEDGSLIVADTNNHRIQRFAPGSLEGQTIAGSKDCKAGSALNELNMPTGICRDPSDGSLLVADRCNSRLLRFQATSKAGTEGSIVAGPELLSRPWGLAVHEGKIYVSDERNAVVLRLGGDASQDPISPEPPQQSVAQEQPAPPPEAPPSLQVSQAAEAETTDTTTKTAAPAKPAVFTVSGNQHELD